MSKDQSAWLHDSGASRTCPRCQGALIRRNPVQLFVAGVLMCASLAFGLIEPVLWIPGIAALLGGLYLIAWAVLAKGMWCRQCKTFARVQASP